MPWRNTSIMEERVFFINEYRSGIWTMTDLCKEFGISRPLGYKYVRRYEQFGIDGLISISKRPHDIPNKTPQNIERLIVAFRKKHPRYGALKILVKLTERYPEKVFPSIPTINNILYRNGLIIQKHRVRRIIPIKPIFDPTAPNQIWSGDFKGKFRTTDQQYVFPLTIADSYSRFLFAAEALERADLESTKAVYIRVFRKYGMPEQFHTDNGSPFACPTAIARLSSLSVWLLEHDVMPVFSDPGCPSQNGRHERMHRELKAEAARPPASNIILEQKRLDKFVKEYNTFRPHQSLGNKTPASVHVRSNKEYSSKIISWDYPSNIQVRRVFKNGAIRWGSDDWVMVSTALIDKYIGLEELGNGIWRVFFRSKLLGYLDEKTLRIQDVKGRSIR